MARKTFRSCNKSNLKDRVFYVKSEEAIDFNLFQAMSVSKQVKGSQNYVWFLDQTLGRGAMGVVVVARHRKKGTKCAAKVYSPETKMSSYVQRELKILRGMTEHLNIVKLIAIEEETHSRSSVVLMELCDGGSVQQILDQPQNHHGLSQQQFMLVLKHTGQALNHLHSNSIVHRDIKPGNILLQITPDGSHIYKLTDFGASKRLEGDDASLKSICGTEEYIHPQLHTSAFIRRVPTSLNGFSVDLWSFGVTLYQCATGRLPFRPKDGIRQDKQMMNELMTNRPPSVISRYQAPDGTIVQETTLPKTSKLYQGTREVVESLLCRLFDTKNPCPVQEFKSCIQDICNALDVCVFDFDQKSFINLQLNKTNGMIHLHEQLSRYTHIPARSQLLLTRHGVLEDVPEYQDTSPDDPIIFIRTELDVKDRRPSGPTIPALPDLNRSLAPLVADGKWASAVCGQIYLCQHAIHTLILTQGHFLSARITLYDRIQSLYQLLDNSLWRMASSQQFLKRLHGKLDIHVQKHHSTALKRTEVTERTKRLRIMITNCDKRHQQLVKDYEITKGKIRQYSVVIKRVDKPGCMIHDRCQEKCDIVIKEALPMYQGLVEDKSKNELAHNEMEIHRFNKSELKKLYRRQQEYITSHCVQQTELLYDETREAISDILKTWTTMKQMEKDIVAFDSELKLCEDEILKVVSLDLASDNGAPNVKPPPSPAPLVASGVQARMKHDKGSNLSHTRLTNGTLLKSDTKELHLPPPDIVKSKREGLKTQHRLMKSALETAQDSFLQPQIAQNAQSEPLTARARVSNESKPQSPHAEEGSRSPFGVVMATNRSTIDSYNTYRPYAPSCAFGDVYDAGFSPLHHLGTTASVAAGAMAFPEAAVSSTRHHTSPEDGPYPDSEENQHLNSHDSNLPNINTMILENFTLDKPDAEKRDS